jgi:hypothetical protein
MVTALERVALGVNRGERENPIDLVEQIRCITTPKDGTGIPRLEIPRAIDDLVTVFFSVLAMKPEKLLAEAGEFLAGQRSQPVIGALQIVEAYDLDVSRKNAASVSEFLHEGHSTVAGRDNVARQVQHRQLRTALPLFARRTLLLGLALGSIPWPWLWQSAFVTVRKLGRSPRWEMALRTIGVILLIKVTVFFCVVYKIHFSVSGSQMLLM